MKKILSIFLSLVLMITSCTFALADGNEDTSAAALMLLSTSPEFGNDKSSTESPTFTFNNEISDASAVLNGEAVACDIDGKIVTLDVTLEQFADYEVTVTVTDVNGQTLSEKLCFSTSGSSVKSITSGDGSSWQISANAATSMTTMMNIKYSSSNFVFYRFPVPVIEDGQNLGSFVLTCYTYAGSNLYSMKFAGDDWDPSAMTSSDEAVAVVFNDVSKKWNNSQYIAADSSAATAITGVNLMYEHKIDITTYVAECMAAQEEYVDIGFVSNSTINLFGFYAKDSGYKTYQASYTYKVSEPMFEIVDVSAKMSGSVLENASFSLLSDVEDINQIVGIRSMSDSAYVESSFAYDEATGKYVLELPVELAAGNEYELVFKADTSDNYGNVNSDEKILARFYASEDGYEPFLKNKTSDGEVFETSVNAETSTISLFYKNAAYPQSDVVVSIALVDSEETAFSETAESGARGSVYLKDIDLPESGSYIVKVVPKNAPYYMSNQFEFFSAEDTARLWATVAISGTPQEIAANWDLIENLFDLESEYFEDISDMNAFYTKLSENRDSSITEMNTENISLIRTFVKNMAFFTAVEQVNDAAEFIKLINSELALIKLQNKEIYDMWVECVESEYAEKTVAALMDSIEPVSSVEELTELMDQAFDVYRVEIILDLLEDADHSSEITDILLAEGNAKLLGIEEYIEEYEALESKTEINESLMIKFDNAKEFKEFFAEALEEAPEPEDDKPSSPSSNKGSSGKGSSGKGSSFGGSTQIVSSAPVVQTPFNPFADVENISWAKDHIVKLYNRGVINGKSQNAFAPYDNVTREEVTKLLVILGKFQPAEESAGFDDVASGSWYEEYVNTAVSNGIVNGIGNSKFGTGFNAARQDIAVMIVNMLSALGVVVEDADFSFGDSYAISDYAKNPVAFLASKGILTGDTSGNFNPKANATRAEVAVMLSRVCDIFVKEVK